MLFLTACLLLLSAIHNSDGLPNIIMMVADDVGWYDVGYHNSFMKTPNIDSLASAGMILNQSYVQPQCSPSRAAFLTGYYPFRLGMSDVIHDSNCLPLSLKLMPEYLQEVGYKTHLVGKWHLGYCHEDCTPTKRGFDSFYGYYSGSEKYYTHKMGGYYDWHNDLEADTTIAGTYGVYAANDRAVDIISTHDTAEPLFLYMAYQTAHTPLDVPSEYEDLCTSITDADRKTFCGMMAVMDESIGNITAALTAAGMYAENSDTIVIFTSDNGATDSGGYNYPLRGRKGGLFEGGTRVPGFVTGPMVTATGTTHHGMFHTSDWFATILTAAGVSVPAGIDGINQYSMITTGAATSRTEMVYDIGSTSALRSGDFKLIVTYGNAFDATWTTPPELAARKRRGAEDWEEQGLERNPRATATYQMFDLASDPLEETDVAADNSALVVTLRDEIQAYRGEDAMDTYLEPNGEDKYDADENLVTGWCTVTA